MRIDHMILVPPLHQSCSLDRCLLVLEQNHEVPATVFCCRSRPAPAGGCAIAQNLVQAGAISETRKGSN